MGPVIPSPHAPQPSALAKLSLRDKLLLAQAVHEIGTSPPDWGKVSALLLAHPLIRKQSRLEQAAHAGLTLGRIFGTRECERAWTALMRQRGLVLSKEESGPEVAAPPSQQQSQQQQASSKPKEARGLQPRMDRKSQLALAQLLYAERMEELKEQIREKEQQFKSLVKEIDEIKSGQADVRLEMELRIEMENLAKGPPLPPTTPGGTVIGSVPGVTTPGGTMITPTKSSKIKGRVRGESSATTPGTDLTKTSPRSDYTGTGSNPNSASKRPDSAKSRKTGDRRSSIGDQSTVDSPTKLVPGPVTSLPSTPSITLPASTSSSAPTAANTDNAAASIALQSGKTNDTEMTTEQAEQAVASAAAEAAVNAVQGQTAAPADVQDLADKLAESESNLELAGNAEGGVKSDTGSNSRRSTASHGVPAADVVVEEQPPSGDTGASMDADALSATQAAVFSAMDAAAREDRSTSTKRKRNEDETETRSSRGETATKKGRRTLASSSKDDDNSEDEAEAALDAKGSSISERERRSSKDAQAAESGEAAEDAEGETPKTGRLARRRSQAKNEPASATIAQVTSSKVGDKDAESDAEDAAHRDESDNEGDEDGEDDDDTKRTTRGSVSRTAPARNRYNSVSSASRLRRGSRAAVSPAAKEEPSSTPLPAVESEREKAHRRKQSQVLLMLLTEVSNHTHGNLFHAPIKEQDAPDYYQFIKQPLDIKTIRLRIKEGAISSASQLRKALNLMFANSLVYNRPGTEVHRMASEMFKFSETIFGQYEGTRRF